MDLTHKERGLDKIGPYTVKEMLGQGGMGRVYRGERSDGAFNQQVAIKVLKDPKTSDKLIKEAQILSQLSHPNIAALYDAGTTDAGDSYIVMELVEGTNIADYFRSRSREVKDKLKVFLTLCEATEFSHRNGIIHSDLKPENILVTAAGEIKLLDFGIARVLDQNERLLPTKNEGAMSLYYASPEHISGQPVSTLSDVYSLGTILYEILTGRKPFDNRRNIAEVANQICNTMPPPPSEVLKQDLTNHTIVNQSQILSTLRTLKRVKTELDIIVLKSISKLPQDRYQSVSKFADDIRCYLDNKPIHAKKTSIVYIWQKWIIRNKLKSLGFVLGISLMISQILFLKRDLDRATEKIDQSIRISEFLVGLFAELDPLQGEPHSLSALDFVDRGSQLLDSKFGKEPLIHIALLESLGRIYTNLGEYDKAENILLKAKDLGESVLDPNHLRTLSAYSGLANNYSFKGQYEKALEHFKVIEDRLGDSSFDEKLLIEAWIGIGQALRTSDRYQEAATYYHKILKYQFSENIKQRYYAIVWNNLGLTYKGLGKINLAIEYYRKVIAFERKQYGGNNINTAPTFINLGLSLSELEYFDEAIEMINIAIELKKKYQGESHPELALALNNRALVFGAAEKKQQALDDYRQALSIAEKKLEPSHPLIISLYGNIGMIYRDSKQYIEAIKYIEKSIQLLELSDDPRGMQLTIAMNNLALCYQDIKDFAKAERLQKKVLHQAEQILGPDHPNTAIFRGNLGKLMLAQGESKQAYQLLDTSVKVLVSAFGDQHSRVKIFKEWLAKAEKSCGPACSENPEP